MLQPTTIAMIATDLTNEKELLDRLSVGDEVAFGILYNQYKGLLYVHAYRKLNNREEAKDVIHSLFLGLWERRAQLDIKENLSAYLYKAVRYKIIDVIARKKTAATYVDNFQSFINNYADNTDHLVRQKVLGSIIDKEIDQLPPKMRRVFELSRKENLTHKEIADLLNISEQSVRSHVKNALQILRTKLGLYLVLTL